MRSRLVGAGSVLLAAALVAGVGSLAANALGKSLSARQVSVAATPGPVDASKPVDVLDRERWGGALPDGAAALTPSRATPASVQIPSLGVDAPVAAKATAPGSGEFDLPADNVTVAWYEPGPTPGESGSSVLAAHVDYGKRPGVFYRLKQLRPGADVTVRYGDGTAIRFVVEGVSAYHKADLPRQGIFRRGGPPVLTLVTCGGSFDRRTHRYRDNTVVTAVPVAHEDSRSSA